MKEWRCTVKYNSAFSANEIHTLFGSLRKGKDAGFLPTPTKKDPCLNCGEPCQGEYCDYGCWKDHEEAGYPFEPYIWDTND